MLPKHFEFNPKIFEQVNNNKAPLSDNKTVNRAATPTKAVQTQFCEKKNRKQKKNLPELFIQDNCTQFDDFFYFMVRKFLKTFGRWPWLGV